MTSIEAPPQKKSIPISQAILMIIVISIFWTAAACLGGYISLMGMSAQGPRFVNQIIADQIGGVIDDYMIRMHYEDTGAAWSLFTDQMMDQITPEDLADQREQHPEWYDGYLGIDVTDADGLPDQVSNENVPYEELMAGRIVTLRGDILYEGDFTGTFVAVMEYESEYELWSLRSIEITVPPEKIEASND